MNVKLLATLAVSLAFTMSVRAATFTVVHTNNSGAGSLRQAILDANANAGADTIAFAITNASLTISPTNALPNLTEQVTIDGSTQSGYSNKPIVELSGIAAGANVSGFCVGAGNCIVRALCVNSFAGSGVLITNGVGSRVEGCYLGVALDGYTRLGNADSGVKIAGFTFGEQSSGTNTIGGETALKRNLISANSYGIWLSETTENVISGNYIGTDETGTFSVGNTNAGIYAYYAADLNIIGGTNTGARNLISGNGLVTGEGESQITYYADGIQINTFSNFVHGNYIGVDVTGTAAVPNTRHGVNLQYAIYNLIGGANAGEGNLISGNKINGVNLGNQGGESLTYGGTPPPSLYGNIVQGNLIGTEVTGQSAIPNENDGVFIGGMSENLVGGPLPGEGNVISGNLFHGVEIYNYYAQSNWIAGNFIGITRSNALPLPNLGNGVLVDGSNNQIGGVNSGDGNIIAYNALTGVSVTYRTGDLILGNSIYANTNSGIDLGGDGVTLNDVGDLDTGANDFQNFPVLSRAVSTTTQTIITASLNSSNSSLYRVEFFDNPTADPSGYGQGKTFLGFTNVTTDGGGDVSFSFTNPTALPLGHYITATATDPAANTSEFSAARKVVSGDTLDIVVTVSDSADPVPHLTNFTYTVTVTNFGPTNASAVFVTNTLSPGLVYVGNAVSQGSASYSSGVVTWNVGALADGAGAVLTITAHGTTTGSQSNSVVAVANEPDNDTSNNAVVETTYIGVADLFVTLDDSPDPVAAGQVVTYVFGVTNRGPDICSSANYSINIDSSSFITGATTTQGTLTPGFNSYILATGPIAVNAGLKVIVTAIPINVGLTFQYGEASGLESDPDFSDNFRTESTVVTNGPGVLKFANPIYYVNENGVSALVPVQRFGGALGTVTTAYASSNLTATAGSDYTAVNGTLTFTNGQTIANITVPITDDFAAECNETLSLNLFNPSGGAILLPLTNTVLEISDNEITPVGTIEAVSAGNTNIVTTGNSQSYYASISDDGRYVAYQSFANNLVTNTDFNNNADVFVHDRVTRSNKLVSVTSGGTAATGSHLQPRISGDGLRVGFTGYTTGLVTNDTSNGQQLYLHTLATGVNQLVSLATNDAGGNGDTYGFTLSTNGTKAAYYSAATDLVANASDGNFSWDVFYRDTATATNILVSVNTSGTATGNGQSSDPVISADGNFVAFRSFASDIAPNDITSTSDIFRRDIAAGTTALVSVNTAGTAAGNSGSTTPFISADGRYVAFVSQANNLVAGTPLFTQQTFRRDMNTGTTIIASRSNGGAAASGFTSLKGMSRDGRYILFDTYASNVSTNDNNFSSDVFVRDCLSNVTYTVSINRTNNGTGDNNSVAYAISPDGRYVTFSSTSSDLVNESNPAFIYQLYQRDLVNATTTLLTTKFGDTNGANNTINDCVVSTNGVAAFSSYATDLAQTDGSNGLDVFARVPGDTNATLLSFALGVTGSFYSSAPAMNSAGTKVAFQSYAVNLVTNDKNLEQDIFLRDLITDTTTLVSVNAAGTGSAAGLSESPALSEDGRYVVYQSTAQNIASSDSNSARDLYLRDTIAGTNALVSINQGGTGAGNDESINPKISPNGTWIVFESRANNLAANDGNGNISDIFIRTRTNNVTQIISLNGAGTASANSDSYAPRISPNGRFVSFESFASNLGPADSNNHYDVYVRDRQNNTNILCSRNLAGNNGGNGDSFQADIAADNDTVIFFSYASDLVAGDANNNGDVFAYHLATRTLELVSATPGGVPGSGSSYGPSISADGRYVAFQSDSTNLVAMPDANGPFGDVFVRDLVADTTTLVSINCHGTKSGNGNSYGPQISADGRYVIYISDATDIVPGSYSQYSPNVFRYDRQTGTTVLISQNGFATGAGNASSYNPLVNSSGSVVTFVSDATDLIANDANHSLDVFAWNSGAVVTGVDLGLTKTASTSVTGACFNLTYTLAVTNNGTAAATGVSVTDALPAGMSFVSANTTQGSVTNSGGTVTASVGNLAIGAGARVNIIVTAMNAGSITNTATATANESDATPANNTSSAVVTVTPLVPPPLSPISTNGNQLLVTWPSATPNVFVVQTTTNLTPAIVWTTVTNAISDNGTVKSVLLNIGVDEPERYFRLKK